MTEGIDIRRDDLSDPQSRALLRHHQLGMLAGTPAEHAYVLDLDSLLQPDIVVWSAWRDGQILGIAALRRLDAWSAEVKSMRTHPDHLRQGVAAALLDHLIAQAREEGLRRLSLETGTAASFAPAIALYVQRGFRPGPIFSDYRPSPYNQYFHLDLAEPG